MLLFSCGIAEFDASCHQMSTHLSAANARAAEDATLRTSANAEQRAMGARLEALSGQVMGLKTQLHVQQTEAQQLLRDQHNRMIAVVAAALTGGGAGLMLGGGSAGGSSGGDAGGSGRAGGGGDDINALLLLPEPGPSVSVPKPCVVAAPFVRFGAIGCVQRLCDEWTAGIGGKMAIQQFFAKHNKNWEAARDEAVRLAGWENQRKVRTPHFLFCDRSFTSSLFICSILTSSCQDAKRSLIRF